MILTSKGCMHSNCFLVKIHIKWLKFFKTYNVNIHSFDNSIFVESDPILGHEWISMAGHQHVLVPVKHHPHRPTYFSGSYGSSHGHGYSPGLFTAKSTLEKKLNCLGDHS